MHHTASASSAHDLSTNIEIPSTRMSGEYEKGSVVNEFLPIFNSLGRLGINDFKFF